MKSKQSERGNVIELVVIGVLVLGIIGLIVWRFVDSGKTTSDSVSTATQTSQNTETNKTDESPSTQQTNSNDGYVVIDDWGVRFKVISGFTVNYYKAPSTTSYEMYEFTTPTVEALSGCSGKVSSGDRIVAMLGAVERKTEKYDLQNMASAPSALYNENKIGNYYYYYNHPQSLCSRTAADNKIESSQADTMQAFLATIEPKQ